MVTKREAAFLVGGIGIGVYGTIAIPKSKAVSTVKLYKEIFAAKRRLQKILMEEYYRIDDAIDTEQTFLSMINPHVNVTFKVADDGQDRSINMSVIHNRSK